MKTAIRNSASASLAAALMIASSAFAIALPSSRDFGLAADGAYVDRVVNLTPDTQSIGVFRNQTVRFVDPSTGQSFVWRFDTNQTGFSLDEIAPAGVTGAARVRAYIWETGRQPG